MAALFVTLILECFTRQFLPPFRFFDKPVHKRSEWKASLHTVWIIRVWRTLWQIGWVFVPRKWLDSRGFWWLWSGELHHPNEVVVESLSDSVKLASNDELYFPERKKTINTGEVLIKPWNVHTTSFWTQRWINLTSKANCFRQYKTKLRSAEINSFPFHTCQALKYITTRCFILRILNQRASFVHFSCGHYVLNFTVLIPVCIANGLSVSQSQTLRLETRVCAENAKEKTCSLKETWKNTAGSDFHDLATWIKPFQIRFMGDNEKLNKITAHLPGQIMVGETRRDGIPCLPVFDKWCWCPDTWTVWWNQWHDLDRTWWWRIQQPNLLSSLRSGFIQPERDGWRTREEKDY